MGAQEIGLNKSERRNENSQVDNDWVLRKPAPQGVDNSRLVQLSGGNSPEEKQNKMEWIASLMYLTRWKDFSYML
jgi:hypothetical protein